MPASHAFTHRLSMDSLEVCITTRSDDGVLADFFPAYDAAFVLPNEKEELSGFIACLALNSGPAHDDLQRRYGPFAELILVARERSDALKAHTTNAEGKVIGGANLLVAGDGVTHPLTINLNYLFVDPAQRGRGLSRQLLDACRQATSAWVGRQVTDVPIFLEVNDPFRLTPEQYREDSEHAGIDQIERLGYWSHLGAVILDFPYVQPALSQEQEDDDTLALAVLGPQSKAFPTKLLAVHLERFFAISVLKGDVMEPSGSAHQQITAMREQAANNTVVALLGLETALPNLAAQVLKNTDRPSSLVNALHQSA